VQQAEVKQQEECQLLVLMEVAAHSTLEACPHLEAGEVVEEVVFTAVLLAVP